MISQDFEAVAQELANAHKVADPSTEEVYLAPDPSAQEIRLVEVVDGMPTTGEVLPYRFDPDEQEGIPFPSVVVLLSREEWRQCREGGLALPPGWGEPRGFKKLA